MRPRSPPPRCAQVRVRSLDDSIGRCDRRRSCRANCLWVEARSRPDGCSRCACALRGPSSVSFDGRCNHVRASSCDRPRDPTVRRHLHTVRRSRAKSCSWLPSRLTSFRTSPIVSSPPSRTVRRTAVHSPTRSHVSPSAPNWTERQPDHVTAIVAKSLPISWRTTWQRNRVPFESMSKRRKAYPQQETGQSRRPRRSR